MDSIRDYSTKNLSHQLRVGFSFIFALLIVGVTHADTLRIDCTSIAGQGSRNSLVFTQTFTNTLDVVTLSTYRGTSFYIDCFNFAITNSGCDGSSSGSGSSNSSAATAAVVEVWAVSTSPTTGEQLGLHPLGQDFFGASLLSAAYYFNETRNVYMLMRVVSLPASCSTAEVSYTYSAYTSTTTPPLYAAASSLSSSAPFIADVSTKSFVRGYPVMISFDFGANPPPSLSTLAAFQFTSVRLGTSFANAAATGSVQVITTNRTRNNTVVNVTTLLWTTTFTVAGSIEIGLRAASSKSFVYAGVVQVYGANPAYFDIVGLDYIQSPALNQLVDFSIYGVSLDLQPNHDTAKFVSAFERSCNTAPASGGIPSATDFGPDDSSSAAIADWKVAFTIPGSYKMCYGLSTNATTSSNGAAATSWSWVSVPRFYPLAYNSRDIVTDATNAVSGAGSLTHTTVAPSTAAPTCTPIVLPSECTLYADPNNNLQVVFTVQYREDGTLSTADWRGNISKLLCVSIDEVAVYELSNDPNSTDSAYLVAGLLCSTTGPSYCDHAALLSALICYAGNGVITTDVLLNASYQNVRNTLRTEPLRILDASGVISGISTANTTNHAAPSNNKALTIKEAAIISATGVACIILGVIAVVAFLAYRKRQFLKQQWGRLGPGETFSTRVERLPRRHDIADDELPPQNHVSNSVNNEAQRASGLALPQPYEPSWAQHVGIEKRKDVVEGVVLGSHHDHHQVLPLREHDGSAAREAQDDERTLVTEFHREATPPAGVVVVGRVHPN